MEKNTLFFLVLILTAIAYYLGHNRSISRVNGGGYKLHSLPVYYGSYMALWVLLPSLAIMLLWLSLDNMVLTRLLVAKLPPDIADLPQDKLGLFINDVRNVAHGVISHSDVVILSAARQFVALSRINDLLLSIFTLLVGFLSGSRAYLRIEPAFRARNAVENCVRHFLIACSSLAILTTIGIVFSVLFESLRFFNRVPVSEFLFGISWSPQIAMRVDQVASAGAFGAVPLFVGTLLIALIALCVAVPVGLFSAIYLSEYADKPFRSVAKPLLEVLAGIPTVVYGFFAALVVAPFIRDLGNRLSLDVSSESALAAGLVMGIMIIPFVSSLADDFINAVPQSLRDGAYALGATQSEAIRHVVIPAALPGIVGGILLAASRAMGKP